MLLFGYLPHRAIRFGLLAPPPRGGGVMATPIVSPEGLTGRIKRWFLTARIDQVEAPESGQSKQRQQPWWKILCLTGVSEKAQ